MIEIKNIRKSFDGVEVLKEISAVFMQKKDLITAIILKLANYF